MTKTMTLNHDSARTRNPLDYITPQPSVPAFMEHALGACSILRRDSRSPVYHEQWVALNVHRASHEELATPMEVDAYMQDSASYLLDVPQPLDARDIAIYGSVSNDDGDPYLVDADFDLTNSYAA